MHSELLHCRHWQAEINYFYAFRLLTFGFNCMKIVKKKTFLMI